MYFLLISFPIGFLLILLSLIYYNIIFVIIRMGVSQ